MQRATNRQAVANAALASSVQVHQNYLTAHLVPSSPAYQQALQAATAQFSTMLPQPEAQKKAFALIEQAVQYQAMLLSYIDVFAGLALIAAALVPDRRAVADRGLGLLHPGPGARRVAAGAAAHSGPR